MTSKYAKGKHAVAECQRSGQKMRYRDLVEDGHVPGLLVHPDWWEPKHPQEIPVTIDDPVALYRPAPEISIETDYGNPEQPTPVPTEPLLADPNTTLAIAMTAGDTQVVLDEALTYDIGQYVFIALDGGGWFVSLIRSTADTPHLTVPFTTPFAGAAAQGNQVYIGSGFILATYSFTVTIGNFAGDPDRVGCQADYWDITPVGDITPEPTEIPGTGGKVMAIGEIADYEAGFASQPQGGMEIFMQVPPGYDATAVLPFELYSTIEMDHALGTLSISTAGIGSGGDLDHGGSTANQGNGTWWLPNLPKIWFNADVGQQYGVRFIP